MLALKLLSSFRNIVVIMLQWSRLLCPCSVVGPSCFVSCARFAFTVATCPSIDRVGLSVPFVMGIDPHTRISYSSELHNTANFVAWSS
ncbi:hypothetical protein B0J17DRAFT_676597 [Rhizoctonia solani]|nr:hypothetical protein B0J17DRAFT_676597 [Rhizoctonia solani]